LFLVLAWPLFGYGQVGTDPSTRSSCCTSRYSHAQLDSLSLDDLGREYRRLRSRRCADCDRYGSDLMRVMILLGERSNGVNERTIRSVMGRPDERQDGRLIYDWRSGHDHLEFTFGEDGKAQSRWYHAYE
jgi:hypothetical protein